MTISSVQLLSSPPITMDSCDVIIDNEKTCNSCIKCTGGGDDSSGIPIYNGFQLDCSNIKIAKIKLYKGKSFRISLPNTPICIPLPF